MEEILKDIKGYEGIYQISNCGRLRSLRRKRVDRNQVLKEKILKQSCLNGYYIINLLKNSHRKCFYVHRLVATAFIPNPDNNPCVNHKDENKKNNNINNLEWCTHRYNSNYGTSKARAGEKHKKKVLQYNKNGELIKEWESLSKVANTLNTSISNISCCCSEKQKTSNGYIWRYK